jgi:hypothetical protein
MTFGAFIVVPVIVAVVPLTVTDVTLKMGVAQVVAPPFSVPFVPDW